MTDGYLLRTAVLAVSAAYAIRRLTSVLHSAFIAADITVFSAAFEALVLVVYAEELWNVYLHRTSLDAVLAVCARDSDGPSDNLSGFKCRITLGLI